MYVSQGVLTVHAARSAAHFCDAQVLHVRAVEPSNGVDASSTVAESGAAESSGTAAASPASSASGVAPSTSPSEAAASGVPESGVCGEQSGVHVALFDAW